MFCTSLRRRPSFSPIVPALVNPNGLNLKENTLKTHDLAIPLKPQSSNNQRILRILLLSNTATSSNILPTSLARIEHFVSLTGGTDSAIVFLLSTSSINAALTSSSIPSTNVAQVSPHPSGLHAYATLGSALIAQLSIPSIPILPLASITALPSLLQTYMRTIASSSAVAASSRAGLRQTSTANAALDLLPHCTTSSTPLRRDTVFALTDAVSSLGELAEVAGEGRMAEQVFERVVDLLGQQEAENVVEFWREEWTVE